MPVYDQLAPMDYTTARRLAKLAVQGDGRVVIGPRVLASLLVQIDDLVAERELAKLRGDVALAQLETLRSRGIEDLRLRTLAEITAERSR